MFLCAVNYDNPDDRACVKVNEGEMVRLGRRPESIDEEKVKLLTLNWGDRLVSRNHCMARREGDSLLLERLPALPGRSKPNVLYSNTAPKLREALREPIVLGPGESAVIGIKGTSALFWLKNEEELDQALNDYLSGLDTEKETFETASIRKQDYDEVEQLDEYSLRLQLKLLQRELPEQVLAGWTNRQELFDKAAAFIENALPGQKGVTAAFIAIDRNPSGEVQFERLHADPVDRADFRPSKTLLNHLEIENPVPSDVNLWTSHDDQKVFRADSLGDKIDWVVAIPVAPLDVNGKIHRDRDLNRPVYLYVETRQATVNSAAVFLPFLRLIASLVASLLSARDQQRIQDRMSTFFSPGLRRLMRDSRDSTLEPTMADCTVMFADRRGSSHLLETAKTDEEILDRLKENQEIVGKITEMVFEHDGVITDFAGDGALSLWGWPTLGTEKNLQALQAVAAAESIVEELIDQGEYEEEHGRFMAPVRLGISTGRIAVGKTGPTQQWHISVFGGVANLGARLERIAKEFKVPVLISDETYQRVRHSENRSFRKLCLISPAGFKESYPIYELIMPQSWGGSGATQETVDTYEIALNHFIKREWDQTIDILNQIDPADEPSIWLKERAEIFRISPPRANWQGEIDSLSK
ncbi:MAG: adenylate/guanylate cyclase domain-containing protein [Verrucomicrobiales bacterium]|nr:adenylate/guanylate cyclase domain-containing protein [Verrucomicrobiales bacterium]